MLLGPVDIDTIKNIIDCVSDGIQIYNQDGYLVYCNEKCEMLDDILSKSAIGKHVTSIYPPLRDGANTIIKVLRSGQPIYDLEQDYINYRGRRLTAITTTLPLTYHKKTVGVIEITRSLTENRELNEKIEKLRLETEALRLSGEIGMLLGGTGTGGAHDGTAGTHDGSPGTRNGAEGAHNSAPGAHNGARGKSNNAYEVPGGMIAEQPDEGTPSADEVDFLHEKNGFIGFERVIEIFEKRIIGTVFRHCNFNITDTANQLKMPRQTLQYKMKKYGISKPDSKKSK